MADLTPTERLQPCLLDRLWDDDPGSQKESRERRVISLRRYRQGVLRDLAWLLNTNCRLQAEHIEAFGQAADSVLNYGIPDLCGLTASGVSVVELERMMVQAIRRFEPRILPESLVVKAITAADQIDHNAVSFEIQGELWAQPMPDTLYVRTDLDLETGQYAFRGESHG